MATRGSPGLGGGERSGDGATVETHAPRATGNTPAVCRGSYINSRTIDLFRSGVTIERTIAAVIGTGSGNGRTQGSAETAARVAELGAAPTVERAVLRMLKQ